MLKENAFIQDAANEVGKAFESGDEKQIQSAMNNFGDAIAKQVAEDYLTADGDSAVLQSRGFRVLTAAEQKFYENVIEAGKSKHPQQTLDSLITAGGMPETIIEDVYRELIQKRPLLERINFVNVSYLTRWILNDHTADVAVWGDINDEIAKEITSSFKNIELTACKLSAFALIPLDMLELGATFLDGYVRTFLVEALLKALEQAIISGNGVKSPIGLDRDIHEGVTVSTTDGYPQKTAVELKSFQPAEYGAVLALLAVSEKGSARTFDEVTLICNQVDYLTKVMPATTVLNANGTYTQNVFPFPTNVVRSNEVATGKAIICLPEEYFMGIGGSKEGTISYSDEVKFLEDQRAFKIKLHGNGRAYDNTVSVLVDISELEAAYITVLNKTNSAETTETETETTPPTA
ncbi:MAG: phage major capsid protein [Eubacterium sp.]|nr:phage major capsid protein [Eubacterium sp.]